MKPLTVGNVVSAGLRIYRDRFWSYYKLAFIGYLWVLVPIYGWAKYSAMMGLISRLAFGEVTEKPESIRDAQRFIKPRMWSFLGAGILVALIFLIAMIVLTIVFGMAAAILGFISGVVNSIFGMTVGQNPNVISIFLGILLGIAGVFFFFFALTWLISRLLMVEVPLAIEENVNAIDAISRSWKLTKGSIFRLQFIIVVSFLISLPIIIATQIASTIIQIVLGVIASSNPELLSLLFVLSTIIMSIGGGALFIPFWQSIKAVIYYDLRVRREGLGLSLEEN